MTLMGLRGIGKDNGWKQQHQSYCWEWAISFKSRCIIFSQNRFYSVFSETVWNKLFIFLTVRHYPHVENKTFIQSWDLFLLKEPVMICTTAHLPCPGIKTFSPNNFVRWRSVKRDMPFMNGSLGVRWTGEKSTAKKEKLLHLGSAHMKDWGAGSAQTGTDAPNISFLTAESLLW